MTDYLSMLPAEFSNHEHLQHIAGVNTPPGGETLRGEILPFLLLLLLLSGCIFFGSKSV